MPFPIGLPALRRLFIFELPGPAKRAMLETDRSIIEIE